MLHLFLICLVRIRNEALRDLLSVKIVQNFYYLFLAFLHVTANAHKGGKCQDQCRARAWKRAF